MLVSSDMASVMHGNEWADLINEFEESGSGDKMNPQKWVYCITDEEEERLRAKYADDELSLAILEALLFNAEDIRRAYDSEDIVLLLYPNQDFINRTLQAVGLEGNYVLTAEEAPGGRLEMFAIAKRTVNDRTHTFSYHAARSDAFTISDDTSAPSTGGGEVVISGDKAYVLDENGNIISSSDVTTGDKEGTQEIDVESDEIFNIDRWRSYYNWCASLTDWANEQSAEASAIELRAAENNDLTKITGAQTPSLLCPIKKDGYQPWGNLNGGDAVNIRRNNTVSFTIYSCHSFTNGSDYYLVKATARTATNYYQDRVVTFTWGDDSFNRAHGKTLDLTANMGGHKDPVNYLSGFTKSMTIYAAIWSGNSTILANTPTNVAKETQYSNTMGWNLSGTIGGSKDGASGSLTGGVSYSETKSFTQKAYEIRNQLDVSNPSWVLAYNDGVTRGSWHSEGYYGISAPAQSAENVEFECGWIWEVKKSVWGGAGTTLTMGFDLWSQEGFAFGYGASFAPYYTWDTQEKYPYFLSRQYLTLKAPAHYWLSHRLFPIPKSGGSETLEVLAEYDWKVSTKYDDPNNRDWIHLSSTSGKATGANKYLYRFEVVKNPGGMRGGHIIFEMDYNGHTESKDIQISQASM